MSCDDICSLSRTSGCCCDILNHCCRDTTLMWAKQVSPASNKFLDINNNLEIELQSTFSGTYFNVLRKAPPKKLDHNTAEIYATQLWDSHPNIHRMLERQLPNLYLPHHTLASNFQQNYHRRDNIVTQGTCVQQKKCWTEHFQHLDHKSRLRFVEKVTRRPHLPSMNN